MQHFIASYGYAAIFVLMLAESACIPVPSELIMTLGGALAAGAVPGSHLNIIGVIAAGVAGNVAGSYIAWAVGRYGGQAALRRWGGRLLAARARPRSRQPVVRAARAEGGADRPPAAGRAHLYFAARRHRRDGRGAVRDLHDDRLHPVDGRAGLCRVRGRRQLAVGCQRIPYADVHHRRGRGRRRRVRDLAVPASRPSPERSRGLSAAREAEPARASVTSSVGDRRPSGGRSERP